MAHGRQRWWCWSIGSDRRTDLNRTLRVCSGHRSPATGPPARSSRPSFNCPLESCADLRKDDESSGRSCHHDDGWTTEFDGAVAVPTCPARSSSAPRPVIVHVVLSAPRAPIGTPHRVELDGSGTADVGGRPACSRFRRDDGTIGAVGGLPSAIIQSLRDRVVRLPKPPRPPEGTLIQLQPGSATGEPSRRRRRRGSPSPCRAHRHVLGPRRPGAQPDLRRRREQRWRCRGRQDLDDPAAAGTAATAPRAAPTSSAGARAPGPAW